MLIRAVLALYKPGVFRRSPMSSSSAAAAYDGAGTGGKARKRPLRRPPSTPYDRPPPLPAVDNNGGWISKLVDPASQIIARSASKLFSSVFRKRLTAPPAAPEENRQPNQGVNAVVSTNPSLEVPEQGGNGTQIKVNNSNFGGAQQKGSCDSDGIFELEKLLKQKTYTRVEFNRLTELLRTRTVEPSTSQPAVACERIENANVLGLENRTRSMGSDRDVSNSAVKPSMPAEEFTSVEELAKSYMGSRRSKVPSALNYRNQIFKEDTRLPCDVPYGKKGSNLSTAPRSAVRFSGIPEVTENGYTTPRLTGRSAMHRMSCSPYFKGGELNMDSNGGPSGPSQWMLTNFMQSGGKQVYKRGSSVLDDDFGSSGSIRRIRRKSNLMSPSKDMRSILTGNVHPSPPSPFINGISSGSAAPIQKPLYLDGPKDGPSKLQHAENGDTKDSFRSVFSMPPQSSEMERKTFQQPDKLRTSSNEKSSKHTATARDELPSSLTVSMLHEQALRSMKDIDCFNSPGSSNLGSPSVSDMQSLKNMNSQKLSIEENGLSKSAFSGPIVTNESDGIVSVVSTTSVDPRLRTTDFATSGSAPVPSPKKPAFQMIAPDDVWERDDDYNTGDTSNRLTTGNDKLEPRKLEGKTILTEILDNSSGSMLNKEVDMKASNRPASGKHIDFSFHVPPPSPISQSPSMPSPLLDTSAPQKEQIAVPRFAFGSDESHSSNMSTTTTRISDPASMKSNASITSTVALQEGLNSNYGLKSSENAALPTISKFTSPNLSAFGASTTSSLSNGTSAASCSAGSSALMFSMITSGASTSAPISVSLSLDKSNSTGLEGVPVKASPFSANVITFGASAISNSGSNSSTLATSISASTSSSPSVATSLFLSSGNSSSALSMAPVSSNPGDGIFGSSAPLSSSSLSIVNNNSQESAVAFGDTAGSTLGTETTQAGKGVLQVSSDTHSQFGSFTSSPAFGLSGFSTGSSSSPLGSAGPKPFGSTTEPSFLAGAAASRSNHTSSLAPIATTSLSSSSDQTSASRISTGLSFGQSNATSQPSTSIFGSSTTLPSTGFSFGQPASTSSQPSSSSVFGSSTTSLSTGLSFGPSAPALCQLSSSVFGSSTTSPSTVMSFGHSGPASTSQPSSSSVFGSSTSSSSSSSSTGFLFGQSSPASSSQPSLSSVFYSSTSSSTGLSFGQLAPSSSQQSSLSVFGSTISSPATGFQFGQSPISTAQPSTSSVFGSSTSSTDTGFSFRQSAPAPGSSSFMFSASSGTAFSFTSSGTTTSPSLSSPTPPVFGQTTGFSSGFPGSDQMNMEDSMADDTTQTAAPMVPTFGEPTSSVAMPSFAFGSPAIPTGGLSVFQFGSQQNPSVPQRSSPFQTSGNLEFSGGSFSLGSTGGDKSGRKIYKINRNKLRKK